MKHVVSKEDAIDTKGGITMWSPMPSRRGFIITDFMEVKKIVFV